MSVVMTLAVLVVLYHVCVCCCYRT